MNIPQYKNLAEFNACIFRDICNILYDKYKVLYKSNNQSEIFDPSSNALETNIANLYNQICDNIPQYTSYNQKNGTSKQMPIFVAPNFNYARFEREIVENELNEIHNRHLTEELKNKLNVFKNKFSPNEYKWLYACSKIFYNIKPSKNSIHFLQRFFLQVKRQILCQDADFGKIMLCLISQSESGTARGGVGKSVFMDALEDYLEKELNTNIIYRTSKFPSTYCTGPEYSNHLFAFISDAENHKNRDFDVSGLNNIIDKSIYTTDEKYKPHKTLKSTANLISTSNYAFENFNPRRMGEVFYWPINIDNLLHSESEDKEFITNKSEFEKYIPDLLLCVPDNLLFNYDGEEASVSSALKQDLIFKYNSLFDATKYEQLCDELIEPLETGSEYTPFVIAKKINLIYGTKYTAQIIYERIILDEGGNFRFKAITNTNPLYAKYILNPIKEPLYNLSEKGMLKMTRDFFIDIMPPKPTNDPDKKAFDEFDKTNSSVDLKELKIPAFSNIYSKIPTFDDNASNEFMCVCPYKDEVIKEANETGNYDISRGKDSMLPLGFVFESDMLDKEIQKQNALNVLKNHEGEILGIVDSGKKSVHVTAMLDNDFSEEELEVMSTSFKNLWKYVAEYLGFDTETLDKACANIGRLTRYPDGTRQNGEHQEKLYWNNKARLKVDVREWIKFEKLRLEKEEATRIETFKTFNDNENISDHDKLMRCKNCSEPLQTLKDVVEDKLPSGANYYGALCAGKAIGLSREYLLLLAQKISAVHPSNIANPENCINSIFKM